MEFRIETITPQIAAEYLAHNIGGNRHLRRSYVETLARDMKNGAFTCTHQGIAFDTDGNLIDGQHRLNAVILAGVPVQMAVARGMTVGTIGAIDKGAQRSLYDTMVVSYTGIDEKSSAMRYKDVLTAISTVCRISVPGLRRISANEASKVFSQYEDECVALYRVCSKFRGRKSGVLLATCLAGLINGVSEDAVRKFIQVYHCSDITDCEGYNVQIVLSWRRHIDSLQMKHYRLKEDDAFKTAQYVLYNFCGNTDVTKAGAVKCEKYSVRDQLTSILKGRGAERGARN